jgi:hypothetical protein
MNERDKKIIENYIDAYNNFDMNRMLENMSDNVIFQNISDGEINLETSSKMELMTQMIRTRDLFSERTQTINSIEEESGEYIVDIHFKGTWAIDMPPAGVEEGDISEMECESRFQIENGQIVRLIDVS